jgi:hypothetical protein
VAVAAVLRLQQQLRCSSVTVAPPSSHRPLLPHPSRPVPSPPPPRRAYSYPPAQRATAAARAFKCSPVLIVYQWQGWQLNGITNRDR